MSPLDYSAQDVTSPSSYLANYYPLNGYMNLSQITDGTANTMFFAEGFANCQTHVTYDYSKPPYNYGYIYKESYGGKRSWNFDPYYYEYSYSYSYTKGKPAIYDYQQSIQDPYVAYFSYYGWYDPTTFQYKPFQVGATPTSCDDGAAQALTAAGVLVCMGDGSSRTVSPTVSITTWQAAGTPQSGDQIGSDW